MRARSLIWRALARHSTCSRQRLSLSGIGCRSSSSSAVLEADRSTDGPPKQKFSALPFSVSQAEASAAYDRYHSRNFFVTRPSAGLKKVKESFLPFWAVAAKVDVHLRGARLGYTATVPVYTGAPLYGHYVQQKITYWRQIELDMRWQRVYTQTDEVMQVYAGYKYPRTHLQRLRPGELMQQATDLHPGMLFSSEIGNSRQLGPFQMKPATLISHVKEVITEEEESAAARMLRRKYGADKVEDLEMPIRHTFITASPFYIPAYVFRSHHFGRKLNTFVSGLDAGGVDGQRAYNVKIPTVLTGLTIGAVILLIEGSAAFEATSTWVWGIALPMSVVGIFTHFLPSMHLALARRRLRGEEDEHAEQNATASWDVKGVHSYSQYEGQRRLQDRERSTFFAQNPGYGQSINGGAAKSPDTKHAGSIQRLVPGEIPTFCAKEQQSSN